jgi:hypothetical protein
MKNIKIWTIVGISLLLVVITVSYNWNRIIGTFSVFEEPKIEKNDWTPLSSIRVEDSLKIIKVVYQEKYGIEKVVCCMAIFENIKTGEYKCIAPWLNLILQKSNLNSFQFETVLKSEMK